MTADHASTAEADRRAHSIMSAVRSGTTVWYALLGGVAAWTIHLLTLAAIVRFTCNAHGWLWLMHLTTTVTVGMVAVALALAWRLAQQEGDAGSDSQGGVTRFIGQLGLMIGFTNLALILLEGLYVFVLASRRCG